MMLVEGMRVTLKPFEGCPRVKGYILSVHEGHSMTVLVDAPCCDRSFDDHAWEVTFDQIEWVGRKPKFRQAL